MCGASRSDAQERQNVVDTHPLRVIVCHNAFQDDRYRCKVVAQLRDGFPVQARIATPDALL
eukprot:scaffold1_cov402-Prasinococcus_capsulatus_cf.AAC.18